MLVANIHVVLCYTIKRSQNKEISTTTEIFQRIVKKREEVVAIQKNMYL